MVIDVNLLVELLFVSDWTFSFDLCICFSNVYYVLRTVKALKSTEISKVITHIIARLFLKISLLSYLTNQVSYCVLVTYLSLIADRYDRKICFEEIIYRWLTLHTCEKWHAKKVLSDVNSVSFIPCISLFAHAKRDKEEWW